MKDDRKCENIIDEYMIYSGVSEAPSVYHKWCGISTVASCVRRQVWIDMGYFKIFTNMYIILVSPPAKSRKGNAINISVDLLMNSRIRDKGVSTSADATTREALILSLKEAVHKTTTPEGETNFHSSITIISKELGVFLGNQNTDMLIFLTDIYDAADFWKYRTIKRGMDSIENSWLSMLAATTPSWLVSSSAVTAIGEGFTSRVIFIVANDKRKKEAFPELSPREILAKENVIHDLEIVTDINGKLEFTPQARDFYSDWYKGSNINILDDDPRFAGYLERKPTHVLKIASVFSIAESSDMQIQEYHIKRAIEELKCVEFDMKDAFGGAGKSPDTEEIHYLIDIIKQNKKIYRKDLLRLVMRDISVNKISFLLQHLLDSGEIFRGIDDGGLVYYEYIGSEKG